jgi:hypothetical protein
MKSLANLPDISRQLYCHLTNIYRIVETLWDIGDWANPDTTFKADKVFAYAAVLKYEGGNAMYLAGLKLSKRTGKGTTG